MPIGDPAVVTSITKELCPSCILKTTVAPETPGRKHTREETQRQNLNAIAKAREVAVLAQRLLETDLATQSLDSQRSALEATTERQEQLFPMQLSKSNPKVRAKPSSSKSAQDWVDHMPQVAYKRVHCKTNAHKGK